MTPLDPADRPADPACPTCQGTLVYAMPQIPVHFYDCPTCQTCSKLGTQLLPDPIRQILRS